MGELRKCGLALNLAWAASVLTGTGPMWPCVVKRRRADLRRGIRLRWGPLGRGRRPAGGM